MALYTTTALLSAVKRRGRLPTSAESYSDQDLIDFANEELQTYIVPFLLANREEYLVFTEDIEVSESYVPVPPNAIGGKLRSIAYSTDGTSFCALPRIEPEREGWVGAPNPDASGVYGYKFEGNDIVLLGGTPAGTLRLSYFRRPNTLVLAASTAEMGAPPGALPLDLPAVLGTSVVSTTFYTTPTTSPVAIGAQVDIVSSKPGFSILTPAEDTFLYQDPVTLEYGLMDEDGTALPFTFAMVGAYLCNYGESPIVQCPVELQPLLIQRIVARILEAEGDPKFQGADATAERMRAALIQTVTPRSEGSKRVVINRNAPGFGRRWRF